MIRDDAVKRVQRPLGFRSDKATEIVDALQDAQVELESSAELPWFLRTEVSSISTVSAEERIEVPDDFLREWEDDALWYFNAGASEAADIWTELVKDELTFLRNNLPGSGVPQAYALDGNNFRIFPTPDAVYVLKLIYYQRDTLLTSNVENLWLKHIPFLLIGKAGIQLSVGFRDKGALAQFAKWEKDGLDSLMRMTTARDNENLSLLIGGAD